MTDRTQHRSMLTRMFALSVRVHIVGQSRLALEMICTSRGRPAGTAGTTRKRLRSERRG